MGAQLMHTWGTVTIANIPKPLQRVMSVAGLHKIAQIDNQGESHDAINTMNLEFCSRPSRSFCAHPARFRGAAGPDHRRACRHQNRRREP
jgi:hypothetical protein